MPAKKILFLVFVIFSLCLILSRNQSEPENSSSATLDSVSPISSLPISPEQKTLVSSGREISQEDLSFEPKSKSSIERHEKILKADLGASIQETSYHTLPGFRAIAKSLYSEKMGPMYSRKAQVVIFKVTGNVPDASRPVLYNPVTQNFAYFNGEFAVEWTEASAVDALAEAYALDPIQSFSHLKLTYFQSNKSEVSELTQLLERLKADPRIVSVKLQMIEKIARPK